MSRQMSVLNLVTICYHHYIPCIAYLVHVWVIIYCQQLCCKLLIFRKHHVRKRTLKTIVEITNDFPFFSLVVFSTRNRKHFVCVTIEF